MYIGKAFAINDRRQQLEFIREIAWGTLTGIIDETPFVTHLPFLLDGKAGKEYLVAHMSQMNPHWKNFADEKMQLAVFSGPNCYISPSWYQSRQGVPTWNYVTAHVYGIPQIINDPDTVYATVKKLVDQHEGQFTSSWQIKDVDDIYIESMLKNIICFQIPITKIECKFKLSQNRPAEDRKNVIKKLTELGRPNELEVVKLMLKTISNG